jgi:hypothetical protein
MLDPKTWFPQAERLNEGGRTRSAHLCGPGSVLMLGRDRAGWNAYCFRCADHGFVPAPAESLAERIARRAGEQAQDAALAASVTLPSPANHDIDSWPVDARLWLYKAGLGRPEIADLGVYYHPPSNRLVLPVLGPAGPIYWQARSIDGRQPKYLNSPTGRDGLVAEFGQGDKLVLTEDILSAYRVGQVTEAWSLIGVHMNDAMTARIVRHGKPVAVWLDPDWAYPVGKRPGVVAAKRITRTLQLAGLDVSRITSRADPKFLSQREIRTHVFGPHPPATAPIP